MLRIPHRAYPRVPPNRAFLTGPELSHPTNSWKSAVNDSVDLRRAASHIKGDRDEDEVALG